ncbi:MAG: transposase [Elusimicrobia bacterium]|nr:transposase [Elusimicrobiota bacterium]
MSRPRSVSSWRTQVRQISRDGARRRYFSIASFVLRTEAGTPCRVAQEEAARKAEKMARWETEEAATGQKKRGRKPSPPNPEPAADEKVNLTDPPPRSRMRKDMTARDRMERKLLTRRGRALYKLRGQTVEPVFGQIKDARGFDRFMRQGLRAVDSEWSLICATHNLLKLWRAGAPPFVPVYA